MLFRVTILIILVLSLGLIWNNRLQTRSIDLMHADIIAALDSHLAEAPEVGFLPRVRLMRLDVSFGETIQFAAVGQWFSVGAGSFVGPDVSVSATIPDTPDAWSIEGGGLKAEVLRVTQATRELRNPAPESDANRAGWEEKLLAFVNRSTAFELDIDVEDGWILEDVVSEDDRLIIIVTTGRWKLPFH